MGTSNAASVTGAELGAFTRNDLRLDASGCYSWCSCDSRCDACAAAARSDTFNRYDGRAVLDVLNEFVADEPFPAIAFAVGELLLAGMCDLPRTRAQVVEWLVERWRAGAARRQRATPRDPEFVCVEYVVPE